MNRTMLDMDNCGLASKADLALTTAAIKTDLADLEARLAWKVGGLIVGGMVSMTGIFALIVAWLTKGGVR